MKLDDIEFRTPIVQLARENVTELLRGNSPSGVGLLLHDVWQRRLKNLWGFLDVTRLSATLQFPSTPAGQCSGLTVSVPGVSLGDFAQVGPSAAGLVIAQSFYVAEVTANSVVTVFFCNLSTAAIAPPSGVFQIRITRQ